MRHLRGAGALGRVDILINNAGNVGLFVSLNITREQWERVMQVNLVSTFLCSQLFGHEMIRQAQGGTIVNVSSIASLSTFPLRASYIAAKAGINALTKVLAMERGVYLALRMAQELVGAAVPEAVLAELRPVDLDEAIVAAARMQVFSNWSVGRTLPRNLANQWYSTRLTVKIGEVWRAIFMPKSIISVQYGVPVHSLRIYLYYPVRLKYLLVRHWRIAFQLYRGDSSLTPLARHKAMLFRWLAEK